MPFKKGEIGNPNGRPKGAKNKISTEQRNYLRDVLLENEEKFKLELKELKGKDFLRTYLSLMQYTLPKPTNIEIKEVATLEEFIAMTPEERQVAIEEVRESLRNEKP
jgi:hypothetical protein